MGRNIVVAAAGRKLGKTLLSAALVETLSTHGFKVAYYKLRLTTGGISEFITGPGRTGCDTWRIHSSGAFETGLLNYGPGSDVMEYLPESSRGNDVVIWETNSAAQQIPEAILVYIDGDIEEPKNPELADNALIHIPGPITEVLPETVGLILSTAGFSGYNPVRAGWKLWLELDSKPVFGGGIARLLEAIRDSGSIIAASRATGIQYRRVWTLISKIEDKLGVMLIQRSRGGAGGGGSTLTPVAGMLLSRFHYLEESMKKAAREQENDHR